MFEETTRLATFLTESSLLKAVGLLKKCEDTTGLPAFPQVKLN